MTTRKTIGKTDPRTIITSHISQTVYIVGDSGVGKSSLLSTYREKKFEDQNPTVGTDMHKCEVQIEDLQVNLYVYDTTGQKYFQETVFQLTKKSQFLIFVFDLSDFETWKSLEDDWIPKAELSFKENNLQLPPFILVGNKCDLERSSLLSTDSIQSFIGKYGCHYVESSAKTGENVQKIFDTIVGDIKTRVDSGKLPAEKPTKLFRLSKGKQTSDSRCC